MRYPLISAVLTSLLLAACGPAPIVSPSPSPSATGNSSTPSPEPSAGESPGPTPSPSPTGNGSTPGASSTPNPTSGTGSNVISNNLGSVRLTPAHLFLSRVGETQRFTVEARDASGNLVDISGLSLEWSSSNPAMVAVDGNGTVKAMSEFGNAVITVREPRSGLSVTGQVDITSYEVGSGGGGGGGGGGAAKPTERINANLTGLEGLGFNEFYVNTSELESGIIGSASEDAVIAMNDSGAAVAVWYNDAQAGVYAQRFAPNGLPLGASFRVDINSGGSKEDPEVAMANDGSFVVTWTGTSVPGGIDSDVYAQVHNADGSVAVTQFRVNQFSTYEQFDPAVAIDADGDFVVTWTSYDQDGVEEDEDVYARVFSNNLGATEFRVNFADEGINDASAVAMTGDGRFLIVWEGDEVSGGDDVDVYGYTFDANANPITQFRVNNFLPNNQDGPDVAMRNDGSFVVVWESDDQDGGDDEDVYARLFNADTSAPASEFMVNQTIEEDQQDPRIDMDADGDFAVTWAGEFYDYNTYEDKDFVYARHYATSGADLGNEFRLNISLNGEHESPDVALDGDGDSFFVWRGQHDQVNKYGILGRRYSSDGQPR